MVATDLAESFRSGLSPHLDHARRVADPFHVVRVGNRCLDAVRRRVQNDTLGHRGRKEDPLYRFRKILSPKASMNEARTGCCWVWRVEAPTTTSSARGWPRNRCVTCT